MASTAPSWVTLADGEEIVWSGHPSNRRVAQELVGETVLVVLGVALALAPIQEYAPAWVPELGYYPLLLSVVGLVLGAATWLRFKTIAYVLTTSELYKKEGLVSRDVETLRLDRVQDHGFEQSAFERIAGYGDVYVSTAGRSGANFQFEDVDRPQDVAARISEQLEDVRGGMGGQPGAEPTAPEQPADEPDGAGDPSAE